MSILIDCTCGKKKYGLMGRPACVTTMADHLLYIFRPRFKEDGTRNTLDLNDPNLGDTIKGLIQQSTSDDERMYPTARVYNFVPSNTDPVYEETSDQTKFLIEGVGQVYTYAGEFIGKDATFEAYKQLAKTRCNDTDLYIVDKKLNVWLVLEDQTSTIARGVSMSSESFQRSYGFAQSSTKNKIPFSFDLEDNNEIGCMIPITPEEHGLTTQDFAALIGVNTKLTPVTNTTITLHVTDPYATVASGNGFVGLTNAEISFTDVTTGNPVAGNTVEVGNGVYTFTASAPMTTGNKIEVSIVPTSLTGYFFEMATTVSL